MKSKLPKKSGRATVDSHGNSIWEWLTDSGSYSRNIDTGRLDRLQNNGLSVTDTSGRQSGIDPYNNSAASPNRPKEATPKPSRKSVDYLRQLSEEIKQGKLVQSRKKSK